MANTYLTEAGAPDRCLIAPHLALGSFLRAMKKSRNITLAAMTRIGPFARLTNSATPWRSVSLRDVTVGSEKRFRVVAAARWTVPPQCRVTPSVPPIERAMRELRMDPQSTVFRAQPWRP
jgi:hypothetical protein